MSDHLTTLASLKNKPMQLPSGTPLTIESWKESGQMVTIKTNGRDYEKHVSQVPAFLASLAPAGTVAAPSGTPTIAGPSALGQMQSALMSALANVQKDPGFIPQAEQVSRLVQTGINLAKVELEALRLSNRTP